MRGYTTDLALAQSLDDVWDLHCRAMADFGFDRVIYGLTRVTGANGSLGDLDDALVLSNHGQSYDDAFINTQMFRDAPGFRWARENAGAIGWGALWDDAAQPSEREREIIAFHRSRNAHAGYTVSIAHNTARTFAVASLTGRPDLSQADLDAIWADEGCRIWTMNTMMHLKVLAVPHRGNGHELSGRQREALEWVGEGKSYRDIATIMGVSMATVEKHLRLAREKLRVSTTSQAVLKAAFQNQIYTTGHTRVFGPDHGPGSTGHPCRAGDPRFTET
ncbi:MAG TPA: LuxR family transcriptional regulator [Rhodobacteraceae bacterium]|nr:LuxR family transcriptional regulator [Paracoccaceae bacterium]